MNIDHMAIIKEKYAAGKGSFVKRRRIKAYKEKIYEYYEITFNYRDSDKGYVRSIFICHLGKSKDDAKASMKWYQAKKILTGKLDFCSIIGYSIKETRSIEFPRNKVINSYETL